VATTRFSPDELVALDESFTADPHAVYQLLRTRRPVAPAQMPHGLRVWVVTRYADAKAALVDPRLAKDSAELGRVFDRRFPDRTRFATELQAHMLNSDPPDHTRLRKLVNRGFTSGAIARLRPRIEAIATELTDRMAAAPTSQLDLLQEFAFPLPMTVICELLGVPEGQRAEFGGWTRNVLSSAPLEQRAPDAAAMARYLTGLVAEKRARPGEDMLSSIVAATEDTDRLSEIEAVSMAFLLLVAGHETTVNLIGNGALTLLRHPDQLAELRADPTLLPGAVEELLRLDGPINLATLRFSTEPLTIAGTEIPADEIVLIALASANRDPDHYPAPDELDIHRTTTNLAFGHGIHHCLGAALARLEGEIAFRTLFERFPELSLAAPPEELSWRHSTLIRGLRRLPVRVSR
jgi:cytochrome P450